jgi:hypothetical protein
MTLSTWFALFTMFIHWRMRGFSMLWRMKEYAEVECWWTHLFDQWLCVLVLALFCIFILWQMTGFSTLWRIRDYAEVEWWRTHLFDQWLWVLGLLFYHGISLANERIQHVMENKGLRRVECLWTHLFDQWLWVLVLALFCIFSLWRIRGFSILWRIKECAEVECLWTHSFNQWLWVLGCFILHIHSLANERIQHVMANEGVRWSLMLIDTLVWSKTLSTWFALFTMFILWRIRGFSMLWRMKEYAEVGCWWTHLFDQ